MRNIMLDLDLFGDRSPQDIERGRKILLYFMESLTNANVLILRDYPDIPKLYESDVIYQIEDGTENWKDIIRIIQDGFGDCEDLACWRCAEYRAAGIAAHPYIKWRRLESGMRYHAVVRLPDGKIEDPSKALGMGAPIVRKPVYIDPE